MADDEFSADMDKTADTAADESTVRSEVDAADRSSDDAIPSDDEEYDAVATERAEQADRADRAEERLAQQRLDGIQAGRRKGGLLGAAMAGAMLSLREIYEGPATDAEIEEVVDNPDEPTDIDTDGITVHVGGTDVWAPPPERR